MTDASWAEADVDERLERTARRLFFMFSTTSPGPDAWRDDLSDRARESWRVSARQVLQEADTP